MPGPATQLSLYEKRELEAEYAAQLKFLQALVDQRSAPWLPNGETPSMEEDEDIVSVKYPAYLRRAPTRQGPFLLQPAPHELDSDINEPLASDLRYVLLEPESTGQDDETATPAISFLLMSYEDGKVDVCIDVARVEATWTRQDSDSVRF